MAIIRIFPAIFLILVFITGCEATDTVTKSTVLMDTFVSFEIRGDLGYGASTKVIDKAIKAMKALEDRFNYFSDTSELAKINNLKKAGKLVLSEEMFEVLKTSRLLCEETNGAFDVSMEPLLQIWQTSESRNSAPNETEIESAQSQIGLHVWTLNSQDKSITINRDGVKINLGGIAKGFIVDRGAEVLKEAGITNALINAGGDIYCIGSGESDGWIIGIRDPVRNKNIIATFKASNKAIATSGGYERYTKIQNQTFSHIIDPRTGYPVDKMSKSVTVVAKDCMLADALATALYILDKDEGASLVESLSDTECVIIDESGKFYISTGLRNKVEFL